MDNTVNVKIVNKSYNELPSYETADSSGLDLRSDEDLTLLPGERRLIHTDMFIKLPEGYEAQIRPRSGLALKYGITVLNTPGTIDSDYIGNLGIILINLGQMSFYVHKGDRIAQLVVSRVEHVDWIPMDSLERTERGDMGFGSTGVK